MGFYPLYYIHYVLGGLGWRRWLLVDATRGCLIHSVASNGVWQLTGAYSDQSPTRLAPLTRNAHISVPARLLACSTVSPSGVRLVMTGDKPKVRRPTAGRARDQNDERNRSDQTLLVSPKTKKLLLLRQRAVALWYSTVLHRRRTNGHGDSQDTV